jgi:uncharacterized protein (TIGR02268 family)
LQRIELALAPAREICVSPGLMTSVVFDVRAEVELQDEVRFREVARGLGTISFLPPADMLPGERLRLMARLWAGEAQELVTFMLVAHAGKATHQVEVYRDQRSRESYQNEVAQERAKVQHLREELQQLQTRLAQSGGLRDMVANKVLTETGIQAHTLVVEQSGHTEGALSFRRGLSYRAHEHVAAQLWLDNLGSEPWTVAHASLVDATGKELTGMKLWQEKPIPAQGDGLVIVETPAKRQALQGELTLVLRDDGGRVLHIPRVTFPE